MPNVHRADQIAHILWTSPRGDRCRFEHALDLRHF
jgi:hypothetical protein